MKLACKFAFCISALFLIFIVSACGTVEYSVKDFVTVEVSGYAEHGKLNVSVNSDTISSLYADDDSVRSTALKFAETFKFEYEGKDEEDPCYSNGDVITINVTYDSELAKTLGVEFIDSSFDFTVDGLEDKIEMSPFEGLSVKFSGVAPYGTVQLDKSNCIQYVIDNVTFYCDNYDLSNGDKVVVRAEYTAEAAERNGYVFTEDVKKYTVVGLSKYVTTMAGVTYGDTTAYMHRMVEKYIAGMSSSYKSLDWGFGEDDSDDDEDDENIDSLDENGEDSGDSDEYDESDEQSGATDEEDDGLSEVEKIKSDFLFCDFDASFEYQPLNCYYSLNSVQYSDNIFSATYRVVGTFVCTESGGSGYINVGDTVVGELYVITSLSGGSVDIKNALVYDDSVINNYYAYSCRSFASADELTSEIYKNAGYSTETLDYLEDQETYDNYKDFLTDTSSSRPEVSHIDIDSSTDTDDESSQDSSSGDSSSDNETSEQSDGENDSNEEYYDQDYSEDYNYEEDYYFGEQDDYWY